MYEYMAKVINVVDGDTIDVEIDLGFDIWHVIRLRLAGIDTPERYTPFGKVVTEYVKSALEGNTVKIVTSKTDKYGRYLAEIFVNENSFNKNLVDIGMAHIYDGGKKEPWTA
jgi:endonuclease YncB( thermonuclease family)